MTTEYLVLWVRGYQLISYNSDINNIDTYSSTSIWYTYGNTNTTFPKRSKDRCADSWHMSEKKNPPHW
jgi:hypothetical protein